MRAAAAFISARSAAGDLDLCEFVKLLLELSGLNGAALVYRSRLRWRLEE